MPDITEGIAPDYVFNAKHQTMIDALKGSGDTIDVVLASYIKADDKDTARMAEHIRTSLESTRINLQNYRVEVKDISVTENDRLYPNYRVSFYEADSEDKPVYDIFCDFPELAQKLS